MFTAPQSIALAWASSSSLLAIRCAAESCKNKSEQSCGSCKWYAGLEYVNDQSKHVADFVWDERGCKEWEKRENDN